MENFSLISLLVLLAVAASAPRIAAAWSLDSDVVLVSWSDSGVQCGGSGSSYGANSTYEANLRHLAAVLPAETSASSSHRRHSVDRAIGYWPNRVQARASCWNGDSDGDGGGDCAACIAEAFEKVERECPFRREASFFGRDCYLRLAELSIRNNIYAYAYGRNTIVQTLVTGMMFQAFGLACLFLLFIQAWRHDRKKGNMTRHIPLLSGDQ